MILSASRRTDIPCRYPEWFMERIRAGYALTRNPMNHAQVSRVPLTPDMVDCIVFWTKDAQNMLPYLETLDRMGYLYYFQFTLTPYGRSIEPGLRDKAEIEDTFIALAQKIGRGRVVWRYDPILLGGAVDIAYHKEQFARLCEKLCGGGPQPLYTDTVMFSFVDLYPKLNIPFVRAITMEERLELAGFIGATAKRHGLRAVTCCEGDAFAPFGIARTACIDQARIEQIGGFSLDIKPERNQRAGCICVESVDIGAYDTCPNGCVYCYANRSARTAAKRHAEHDPHSELLGGTVAKSEKITERNVRVHRQAQTKLF